MTTMSKPRFRSLFRSNGPRPSALLPALRILLLMRLISRPPSPLSTSEPANCVGWSCPRTFVTLYNSLGLLFPFGFSLQNESP